MRPIRTRSLELQIGLSIRVGFDLFENLGRATMEKYQAIEHHPRLQEVLRKPTKG